MTAEPWTPACMEPGELADWERLNHTAMSMRAALPCADCLPSFAAEMRAEGRCNGTPRGTEEPMLDDRDELARRQIAAVRGGEARLAQVREAKPDAVELVLETPCGTCAHAPVCARKRLLDAIGDVPVRMPELEDGLVLTLHAVVECDQYLRAPKAKAATVSVVTSVKPGGEWTPERRARMSEAMRRRNLAKAGQQG